jgi:hypothetical protein
MGEQVIKKSLVERMNKETVLLKAGQYPRGHVVLEATLFSGLKPGLYRIETVLYCWKDKEFNEKQQSELQKYSAPFLRGQVPASTRITLTC